MVACSYPNGLVIVQNLEIARTMMRAKLATLRDGDQHFCCSYYVVHYKNIHNYDVLKDLSLFMKVTLKQPKYV